ncbi:RHS repeat-associated core domain-containing protein [Okeania sp. KiyG1]|uniref:RHS repeat-associated core domain-containing protein n=1 Tax=Okeania sp. KiyG1 TaxID=2720165 RepID=UPI001F461196|nr:RHS repeat-associated core domain-containing protein [Okeania sp. KiyG1]
MDDDAQIISYEEYFPYGGTAFIAGKSQQEVKLKEYRYSGKERDDSTGLYYYGARYYAPWLGRWLKPDPAGTVDGLNLYGFVGGNPVTHVDIGGMMQREQTAGEEKKPEPYIVELFNSLKLLRVEGRAFDFPMSESCETRAKIIQEEIQKQTRSWHFPTQFSLRYPDGSGWTQHVATGIKDFEGTWWMLDTSFTDRPLTKDQWAIAMYRNKKEQLDDHKMTTQQMEAHEAVEEFLSVLQDSGDFSKLQYPEGFDEVLTKYELSELKGFNEDNNAKTLMNKMNDSKEFEDLIYKQVTKIRKDIERAKVDTQTLSDSNALENVQQISGLISLNQGLVRNLILNIDSVKSQANQNPPSYKQRGAKRQRLT